MLIQVLDIMEIKAFGLKKFVRVVSEIQKRAKSQDLEYSCT